MGGRRKASCLLCVLSGGGWMSLTAVRLVTDMARNRGALRPVRSDVESIWYRSSLHSSKENLFLFWFRVAFHSRDNCTKHALNVSDGSVLEFQRNLRLPGGLGVIYSINNFC